MVDCEHPLVRDSVTESLTSVFNWVLAIHLVQWLGWVFDTQERKKVSPSVIYMMD